MMRVKAKYFSLAACLLLFLFPQSHAEMSIDNALDRVQTDWLSVSDALGVMDKERQRKLCPALGRLAGVSAMLRQQGYTYPGNKSSVENYAGITIERNSPADWVLQQTYRIPVVGSAKADNVAQKFSVKIVNACSDPRLRAMVGQPGINHYDMCYSDAELILYGMGGYAIQRYSKTNGDPKIKPVQDNENCSKEDAKNNISVREIQEYLRNPVLEKRFIESLRRNLKIERKFPHIVKKLKAAIN